MKNFILISIFLFFIKDNVICQSRFDSSYIDYYSTLVLIYNDTINYQLTEEKKHLLDTFAKSVKSFKYDFFFIINIKLYSYNKKITKVNKLKCIEIFKYLNKFHKIKKKYLKLSIEIMEEQTLNYFGNNKNGVVRISVKIDKKLKNPYKKNQTQY